MKAKLIKPKTGFDGTLMEPGTIIDHPKAYRLVMMGDAEAADDECRTAVRARKATLPKAGATDEVPDTT